MEEILLEEYRDIPALLRRKLSFHQYKLQRFVTSQAEIIVFLMFKHKLHKEAERCKEVKKCQHLT